MNSEHTTKSPKRKLLLVRALSLVVIFATVGIFFVDDKQTALMKVCARSTDDIQVTLDACDTLIARFAGNPAAVSLHYRHKMRAYAHRKDWDAALAEVKNAIAADPASEVPWQWKAWLLYHAGNPTKSLEALKVATDLNPKSHYTLSKRYYLLSKLKGNEDIDAFVSGRIRDGDWLEWMNEGLRAKFLLNLAEFPRSRKAILREFFEFQKEVRRDPTDLTLRRKLINTCRYLGPHCPPLFPERRASYPNETCDAAINRFLELKPSFTKSIKGVKNVPARDLISERDWRVKTLLQMELMTIMRQFAYGKGNPADSKPSLILLTRLIECVSDGKFFFPDHFKTHSKSKIDDKMTKFMLEHLYGPELRRNLVDLAHATPDE